MKKTSYIAFAVVAAAFLAGSCAMDPVVDLPEKESAGTVTEITVSLDGETTKTSLGTDLAVNWSKGDRIALVDGTNSKIYYYELTSGAGSGVGRFKFVRTDISRTAPAGDVSGFKAVYPAFAASVSGGTISVTVNPDYLTDAQKSAAGISGWGTDAPFAFANSDVKVSHATTGDASTGYNFKLRQLATRCNFTFDLTKDRPDEVIRGLKVEAMNGANARKLSGKAAVDFTDVDKPKLGDGDATSVEWGFAEPKSMAEPLKLGLTLLSNVTKTDQFKITLYGKTDVYTFYATPSNDLLPGTVLSLPIKTGVNFTEGAAGTDFKYTKEAFAGVTPHRSTVECRKTDAFCVSAPVPTTADLLWRETSITADPTLAISGNKLTVSGISGTGNMLVAIRAAAAGPILWTYHIWVPEADPTAAANLKKYSVSSGEYEVMPMALGATNTTAGNAGTNGLYYQWGRKDPLGRASSLTSDTYVATSPIMSWTSVNSTSTIANTIQNPTTFYYKDNVWLDGAKNDNLWGNPTGYSNPYPTNAQTYKSVYDPCPAGYKVAPKNLWNSLTSVWGGYGRTFNVTSGTDYYPASGFRHSDSGGLGIVGSGGYDWGSSPYSDGTDYAGGLFFGQYIVNPLNYNYRAFGFSVRCVKENGSAAPVKNDLNYYGNANSYVVKPPASSTASVTVDVTPHRASADFRPNNSVIQSDAPVPVRAALIWRETAIDAGITMSAVANNKFTVSKISGTGNALVGIYDDEDNLLWSYHIWVPSVDPTAAANLKTYPVTSGTYKVMPMALGATNTTAGDAGTIGLYYQWGRKDPLGRAGGLNGSSYVATKDASGNDISWNDATHITAGPKDIAYSVSNPAQFIKGSSSNSNDWTTNNDNLWGNPAGYSSGTPFGYPTNAQTYKSVYDPCPAGYKVAPRDLWTSSTYAAFENYGRVFNGTDYYPASGYRDCGSGDLYNVGSDGYYWSSSPYSAGNDGAGGLGFNSSSVVPLGDGDRANGFSVRCVSEVVGAAPVANPLNYYGKANCYLAYDKNSVDVDITPHRATTEYKPVNDKVQDDALVPTAAALLWRETSITADPTLTLSGNKLTVSGIAGTGNMLVAIKDSKGSILWSYHIWVPSVDPTADANLKSYAVTSGTYNVMPMALGATNTTAGDAGTNGLYYQWGRKDPLGRTGVLNANTYVAAKDASGAAISWNDATHSIAGPKDIAYSVSNPTVFIKYGSSSRYDWLDGAKNDNLWGNPAGYGTGNPIVYPTNSQTYKSVYDPCPAGYKVAPRDLWTSSTYAAFENYGRVFNGTDYYPASGYRDCGSGDLSNVGSVGSCWSSSPGSADNGYAGDLYFSSNGVYPLDVNFRASGFSVRCVQE